MQVTDKRNQQSKLDLSLKMVKEIKLAYRKYLQAGAAKKDGLIDIDSNGDIKAYDKYLRKQTAKNAGFIDEDGKINIKAYDKYAQEKTARNAGFIDNGKGDFNAYKKHLRTKIKTVENDICLNINYLDMKEESHLILA